MTALQIRPLDAEWFAAYDRYVELHERGSVFHTRAWGETVAEALGATARTLIATRGSAVVGALPLSRVGSPVRGRRLLSTALCRFLPILAAEDEVVLRLVEAATRVADDDGCRFLELRCGASPALPGAVRRVYFDNWTIPLTGGLDGLWAGFHAKSTRRSIRIAERSPVRIVERTGPEAFEALHRLDRIARQRQGVPHHPHAFVTGLGRRFAEGGRATLLFGELDGEPIAAELTLRHAGTVHAILAADVRDVARPHRANHLLLHEAMKRAIGAGATRFDLGPAHRANTGLVQFKRYFGAVPEAADTCYLPLRGAAPDDADLERPSVRVVRGAMRLMPSRLHTAISPTLLREVA